MTCEAKKYQKYLVTRTETVTIWAGSVTEAEFLGAQTLDFFGSDTSDLEVEELEDDDAEVPPV